MRRYACTADQALEMLVDGYLEPQALWFQLFVDRRERALLITANRHYLLIDEPERAIDPALEPILDRIAANDPDLIVVPRMANQERARHMEELTPTIAEPAQRASFERRARAMRERWDDHWRPGSFSALADDLPAAKADWRARITASARNAITQFLLDQHLQLSGLDRLNFD